MYVFTIIAYWIIYRELHNIFHYKTTIRIYLKDSDGLETNKLFHTHKVNIVPNIWTEAYWFDHLIANLNIHI
jgi:hypothetical protein